MYIYVHVGCKQEVEPARWENVAAAAAGWLICERRLCVWLRDADENNSNALQHNFATFGLIYTGRNFIQFPGKCTGTHGHTHRLTQTRHPAACAGLQRIWDFITIYSRRLEQQNTRAWPRPNARNKYSGPARQPHWLYIAWYSFHFSELRVIHFWVSR